VCPQNLQVTIKQGQRCDQGQAEAVGRSWPRHVRSRGGAGRQCTLADKATGHAPSLPEREEGESEDVLVACRVSQSGNQHRQSMRVAEETAVPSEKLNQSLYSSSMILESCRTSKW
jgi:hypothetical protein